MANTLILYDGRQSSAERVANAIGYIIGNVRIAEIEESPEEISVYDGFCFIFNFYGALTAGKTKSYLLKNREGLLGKRIAFVGLGFSDAGFTKYVVDMEFAVGGDLSITGMFIKDERTTSEVGYQIAKKLRAPVSVMSSEELSREVDAFVNRHTTMALSTGGGNRIRCTPLEYLYLDGVFYIISEGGLKFSNILDNSNVSAAIFDEYTGNSQPLAGLQMYGVAEQVAVGSDDYWNVLAYRGVTEQVLQELPVTLFVLRIIPMTYEYLNSTFAEAGYDARQVLSTRFRAERWESSYASLHAAALKEEKEREKAADAEKKPAPGRGVSAEEETIDRMSEIPSEEPEATAAERPVDSSVEIQEQAEPEIKTETEAETVDLSAEILIPKDAEESVEDDIEETDEEVVSGEPAVASETEDQSEETVEEVISGKGSVLAEDTAEEGENTEDKTEGTEDDQTSLFSENRELSGEVLFRNTPVRNEEGIYENINAQKHSMGAEIRKIFQGGGLSFADQLERQRAEEEGLEPEIPEEEKMPQKGIFEEESAYRKSISRTSSFIEEEETEPEEKESRETYTLEDLERDSRYVEEPEKTDSGKKKKFTDFFKKSDREELFDEESFADEFDEVYEEEIEEEIPFGEKPVSRAPKKKKQGGFFATGFGKSIGRFLGISPDMEDEEDEDEDEDFDEELEEEDEDFDLSDDEDIEESEPGWMVRLRELREDEEVEADDAELYGLDAESKDEADESAKDSGPEDESENSEASDETEDSADGSASATVSEDEEDSQAEQDDEIDAIGKALIQKLEDAEKEAEQDVSQGDAVSKNERFRFVPEDDSEYVDEFELEDEEFESSRMSQKKENVSVSENVTVQKKDEPEESEPVEAEYGEGENGSGSNVTEEYEEFEAAENEDSEENSVEIESVGDESESEKEADSSEAEAQETEAGFQEEPEPVEAESEERVEFTEVEAEEDEFEDEFESEDGDFEEISDSEDLNGQDTSAADVKKDKKTESRKKPFESLRKKLFGDLEDKEDDLDDDDLYDDEFDDEDDELDDNSFITNFTEVLRLAIGGKPGKSKKSKIRLPEKEEKVREDDEELMEMEALISGLAEKEADSGNRQGEEEELFVQSEEENPVEEREEADIDKEEPLKEQEPSELYEKEPLIGQDASELYEEELLIVQEPSEPYEEDRETEPDKGSSFESSTVEEETAEKQESIEEYSEEEITVQDDLTSDAEADEEFDVDEYEDSQLDFADDDDSDIIIPGTARTSMSDIVIRGFEDDPKETEPEESEEEEESEDAEEDDWETDYISRKRTSSSVKNENTEEKNSYDAETERSVGPDKEAYLYDEFEEDNFDDDSDELYEDDDYEDDDYDDDDYEEVEWVYEEDDDVADASFEPV